MWNKTLDTFFYPLSPSSMEVYWIGLKDPKQELKVINNRKYIESEISKAGEGKNTQLSLNRHMDG